MSKSWYWGVCTGKKGPNVSCGVGLKRSTAAVERTAHPTALMPMIRLRREIVIGTPPFQRIRELMQSQVEDSTAKGGRHSREYPKSERPLRKKPFGPPNARFGRSQTDASRFRRPLLAFRDRHNMGYSA